MDTIEKLIKEYSSKKLKEIVEEQYPAYDEKFIDYAEDELIRRGESFKVNCTLEKEVAEMSDDDLQNLVENEWEEYHLVYMELARKEYIRRGFKNLNREEEIENTEQTVNGTSEKKGKYPALSAISVTYVICAFLVGILTIVIAFISISQESILQGFTQIFLGIIVTLFLVGASETIKVVVDIEENTRRGAE